MYVLKNTLTYLENVKVFRINFENSANSFIIVGIHFLSLIYIKKINKQQWDSFQSEPVLFSYKIILSNLYIHSSEKVKK